MDHTLKFHAAKAKVQAATKVAAHTPSPKKPRVLKGHDSFEEFTGRMAAAMPAASPIPAGPPLSFRAEIEGQWDAFFGGASIPLMENPYEWWRGQLPSELGWLFPVVRRFFAVPASNGDIERFFSECKMVFTDLRSGMAEQTMEMWMMLSYNMEALGMWSPLPDEVGPQVGDEDAVEDPDLVV